MTTVMTEHLQRIFALVRKTGDRVILADLEGRDAFVVMPFEEYEQMVQGMGVGQNPPISSGEKHGLQADLDIWESMKEAKSSSETWDLSKMSPTELQNLEQQYQTFVQAKEITSDKSEKKQVFSEGNDAEESGEEQFYLEPIE
jgi:hypothetical protein